MRDPTLATSCVLQCLPPLGSCQGPLLEMGQGRILNYLACTDSWGSLRIQSCWCHLQEKIFLCTGHACLCSVLMGGSHYMEIVINRDFKSYKLPHYSPWWPWICLSKWEGTCCKECVSSFYSSSQVMGEEAAIRAWAHLPSTAPAAKEFPVYKDYCHMKWRPCRRNARTM